MPRPSSQPLNPSETLAHAYLKYRRQPNMRKTQQTSPPSASSSPKSSASSSRRLISRLICSINFAHSADTQLSGSGFAATFDFATAFDFFGFFTGALLAAASPHADSISCQVLDKPPLLSEPVAATKPTVLYRLTFEGSHQAAPSPEARVRIFPYNRENSALTLRNACGNWFAGTPSSESLAVYCRCVSSGIRII